MQKTIVALYDDVHDAELAVRDLIDTGINRDQISLMASNVSGDVQNVRTDLEETSGAAEGAGVGAGIGAALGGIGGLLVGLGALIIPGVGPVLAAGPLAAAIGGVAGAGAGAVAGGAAGGLIGALADMGVNEEQAGYYAEGIRRGGTLLTVRADESLAPRAVEVMNRHHPIDVRQRAAQWRESGWKGFDPNAGVYDSESVRGAGRDMGGTSSSFGSTGTTGMGSSGPGRVSGEYDAGSTSSSGRTGLADEDAAGSRAGGVGGDIGSDEGVTPDYRTRSTIRSSSTDYDTSRTSDRPSGSQGAGYSSGMGSNLGDPGSGFVTRTFEVYEADFRNDFNNNFANRGYTYNQYQPAYRYGYDLATNDRYRGREWAEIEADARRDWEAQYPDSPWESFKFAVRNAWNRVRSAVR